GAVPRRAARSGRLAARPAGRLTLSQSRAGWSGYEQVPDRRPGHRRCRLFQPVERRAAEAVAGVRVCPVLEADLEGPQAACPGGVVQSCRVSRPAPGGARRVTGPAICRAGPVAQQGADILRIVLAALVSGAAGTDP